MGEKKEKSGSKISEEKKKVAVKADEMSKKEKDEWNKKEAYYPLLDEGEGGTL